MTGPALPDPLAEIVPGRPVILQGVSMGNLPGAALLTAEQWVTWQTHACARCGHWRAAHGEHATSPSGQAEEWLDGPCTHQVETPADPLPTIVRCHCPSFVEPELEGEWWLKDPATLANPSELEP